MAAPSEHPTRVVRPVIEIRPSNIHDVEFIAKNLRRADQEEITAATGLDAFSSLARGFYRGILTFTAFRAGVPIGLFGTSSVLPVEGERVAWIWMVGTDQLTVNPKELMQISKEWLPVLSLQADAMMNYVDSRNTKHINWLKHLGFSVDEEESVFLHNPEVPFFPFTLELTNV